MENIPLTSDRVSITIVETGSGSAPLVSTPAMYILEELSLQMVRQFFTTMEYCTKLVLSGRSSFEFVQILLENQVILENQVKNIRQAGGSDQVRAHQVLVEQLSVYSKDLRNLESNRGGTGTWKCVYF